MLRRDGDRIMSARGKQISAPLAFAILGLAFGVDVAHGAPGQERAAGVSAGVDDATPAAAESAPSRKSSRLRASPAKPVAPIAIGYEFSTQPALGVPFDVRISVRGGYGISNLTLAVHPGEGIQAGTPLLTASSDDGVERTWTLAASAFAEGTLYLGVLVQGTAGDQHPARNLVIPIRIGTKASATPPAAAQPTTDPSGRPVIVLRSAGSR
jgi:hypothetical protein